MSSHERIVVKELLSEDLAMRTSAADLFKAVESTASDSVEVDFSGIRSCTRSFADEYDKLKHLSSKTVRETNMPISVHQLLMAVANPKKKDQVVDIERLKVKVL
jgi:hypothetical protein